MNTTTTRKQSRPQSMGSYGWKSSLVATFMSIGLTAIVFAAWRINWIELVASFLTWSGRISRILILLGIIFNWKSIPLVWTIRVWLPIVYHTWLRRAPVLSPSFLFKPIITPSRTSLLEVDYNLHKSNSTYFSDLDVSRSHLVSYLCHASLSSLVRNSKTNIIKDPKTGKPIRGKIGVILGAVECNFKREIAPYEAYEMWSQVLTWDRKWLYIVTHFVTKNSARPTEWLDPGFSKMRIRGRQDPSSGWGRHIFATAITKYVFKLGRYTVHPAHVLGGDSALLPERPGGWMSGGEQLGDASVDLSDVDLSVEGDWDWRRVEAQRRSGMSMAIKFQELEELHGLFNGGNNGVIGKFGF